MSAARSVLLGAASSTLALFGLMAVAEHPAIAADLEIDAIGRPSLSLGVELGVGYDTAADSVMSQKCGGTLEVRETLVDKGVYTASVDESSRVGPPTGASATFGAYGGSVSYERRPADRTVEVAIRRTFVHAVRHVDEKRRFSYRPDIERDFRGSARRKVCGDKFISGIGTGAAFEFRLRINSTDVEQQQRLRDALSAVVQRIDGQEVAPPEAVEALGAIVGGIVSSNDVRWEQAYVGDNPSAGGICAGGALPTQANVRDGIRFAETLHCRAPMPVRWYARDYPAD